MAAMVRILGTAAGPGVPSFFCYCKACEEARQHRRYARTRTGLCLYGSKGKILIDASPDLRQQLLDGGISEIDTVYLSHWHADHYEGLAELEYYVQLHKKTPLPLVLPESAQDQFAETFPDLVPVYTVSTWQFGTSYREDDFTLTPLPAVHGIETAGFLIEGPLATAAYFPDTNDALDDEVLAKLKGVDYLICDATFNGDNWYPHAHMNVEQAVQLGKSVGAKQTILTHLAMHYANPITTEQLEMKLESEKNVKIAYDGMTLAL